MKRGVHEKMRPIDIARKLKLSTSALRNYEAQGLVPPVERSAGGYRLYTAEHVAYFTCIQAMSPGFGMEVTAEVVRNVQARQLDAALWRVNEVQALLQRDKQLAESNMRMFCELDGKQTQAESGEAWLTIKEASRKTGLPSSTIRHWEKTGLITTTRDPQNGYRLFNRSHIRKIMLLQALRAQVYSPTVVELKNAIAHMREDDVLEARKIATDFLQYLHRVNCWQMRGIHALYDLCRLVKLVE